MCPSGPPPMPHEIADEKSQANVTFWNCMARKAGGKKEEDERLADRDVHCNL